ncbi:hypothetical protein [Streptomyces sp. NBC_00038]|uniref:hypothetical protein n=1 Tax=Streptomyces sp. NBC_00038 TaxID=2903615 RepID=UPI002255978D|nr:hypothetical protein [Streptomyces sp. NBC_00038]MCX5554499.1 hypothetical protein [Streptomyces sp. NBC_00038]
MTVTWSRGGSHEPDATDTRSRRGPYEPSHGPDEPGATNTASRRQSYEQDTSGAGTRHGPYEPAVTDTSTRRQPYASTAACP